MISFNMHMYKNMFQYTILYTVQSYRTCWRHQNCVTVSVIRHNNIQFYVQTTTPLHTCMIIPKNFNELNSLNGKMSKTGKPVNHTILQFCIEIHILSIRILLYINSTYMIQFQDNTTFQLFPSLLICLTFEQKKTLAKHDWQMNRLFFSELLHKYQFYLTLCHFHPFLVQLFTDRLSTVPCTLIWLSTARFLGEFFFSLVRKIVSNIHHVYYNQVFFNREQLIL